MLSKWTAWRKTLCSMNGFSKFAKMEFLWQSFFFFIKNLFYSLYIEIISRRRVILLSTNWNLDSHTKISELIVFIHILQILFGLQHKLLFWAITQEKSKESFPIGDIFLGHALHTCNPLVTSLFLILLLITK